MTPAERAHPEIIFTSRRERIARGAGATTREVEALLKNFDKMKSQMKQLSQFGSPEQLMNAMKDKMGGEG
jgi:signal recognition particle subunit SRP54